MDEYSAQAVVDRWSGGSGLVPRGPKIVLAARPCMASDVEMHTGRRPPGFSPLWRVEVGGRFLRSGGVVYPSGVPFPEELHSQTAVIANEVWLYVDDDGDVLGVYWWPDAVRRPIASVPRADYGADLVVHPADAQAGVSFPLHLPDFPPWEPVAAVCLGPREAIVFLTQDRVPDPLNEMVIYEQGGLSLRLDADVEPPAAEDFARKHSPPYRRLRAPGAHAVGREPGRSLGPQTWPWPGELRWWNEGVNYELKGFVPLQTLQDVAATVGP